MRSWWRAPGSGAPVELLDLLAKIHERRLNDFDAAFDATVAPCAWIREPDVIAHIDRLAESSGRWSI